jgi:hypothetical protein
MGQVQGINMLGVITDLVYSLKRKIVTIEFDVIPVDENNEPIVNGIIEKMRYSTANVADNTTLVDAATGAIIDTTVEGFMPDDTMIGQYDFFKKIAGGQSVIIDDMLMQYLQLSKATGAWKPK